MNNAHVVSALLAFRAAFDRPSIPRRYHLAQVTPGRA
jgi:hypothetical protein